MTSFNDVDENGNEIPIVSYTYDDNGIRTSKTFDDKTYYYTNINGNVTSQYQLDENGNAIEIVQYIYDSANDIIGFTYENQTYFYLKNLQNDIIAIVDDSGNIQAEFRYSAWGEIDYSYYFNNDLDSINPFGYRSYMYDDELGAYYLQSRYYVSGYCRFLNSDLPEYAQMQKDDYVGLNLFAYCCNDPVNNVDPSGYWGADIHYGRAKNDGDYGYYDGTYEWAILVGYKEKYATRIAEGNMDLDTNKNTTPNPLRAINSDYGLADRQKYHFNRSENKNDDSREIQGYAFYDEAVDTYNNALRIYNNNKSKIDKQFFNKNDRNYKNLLASLKKTRDNNISKACFILGKALHCYQDIEAHGNIAAGAINANNLNKLKGHIGIKGVDNPYYSWKAKTNRTKVVKLNHLSKRYYRTQDFTITELIYFLRDISNPNYIAR